MFLSEIIQHTQKEEEKLKEKMNLNSPNPWIPRKSCYFQKLCPLEITAISLLPDKQFISVHYGMKYRTRQYVYQYHNNLMTIKM